MANIKLQAPNPSPPAPASRYKKRIPYQMSSKISKTFVWLNQNIWPRLLANTIQVRNFVATRVAPLERASSCLRSSPCYPKQRLQHTCRPGFDLHPSIKIHFSSFTQVQVRLNKLSLSFSGIVITWPSYAWIMCLLDSWSNFCPHTDDCLPTPLDIPFCHQIEMFSFDPKQLLIITWK